MAVPRALPGASREISEGNAASRKLKAVKKAAKAAAGSHQLPPATIKASCERLMSATAPSMMARMRPCRSAWMIIGTMANTEMTKAGRYTRHSRPTAMPEAWQHQRHTQEGRGKDGVLGQDAEI